MAQKNLNFAFVIVFAIVFILTGGGEDNAGETEVKTRPVGAVELRGDFGHHRLTWIDSDKAAGSVNTGLSVVVRPLQWRAGRVLPHYGIGLGVAAGTRIGVPSNTSQRELLPYDRPYNGYTYGRLSVELLGVQSRLTVAYSIGATGAWSQAEPIYELFEHAEGWEHITDPEINQNLWFDVERQLFASHHLSTGGHLFDVGIYASTSFGEVRIGQAVTGRVRLGHILGPLEGTTDATRTERRGLRGIEAFVFGEIGGELVLFDTLIDGPVFDGDPYEVTAAPFIVRGQIGATISPVKWVALRYTVHIRGYEIELPDEATFTPRHRIWAALELAVRI